MDDSDVKKLQQLEVNTNRKLSTSLLKDKYSEVAEIIVISESSDDDHVEITTVTNTDAIKHSSEEMFTSKFTNKQYLESQGTQTGCDKGHQQTKSNWEGISIKKGLELEVTESNSADRTISTTWTEESSISIQKKCLGEIQESNPGFPVKRIFTALRKKYKEHGRVLKHSARSKRKLHPNERGESEKLPKRWRCNMEEMEAGTLVCGSPSRTSRGASVVLPARGQPGRCRLSRTQRLRQQEESISLGPRDEPTTDQPHQPDFHRSSLRCHRKDKHTEDRLWTDKYCPRNSSEVIGNSTSVKKLHSWLQRWKLRADGEAKRRKLEKRQEDDSDGSWDCGDFQGEACEEGEEGEEPSTTMLITGPSGVGKTASVYACALELGFKVFEVNASCQRSGHHVLSQLKEATQSHLVDIQGESLLKPTYLKNRSSTKPDTVSGRETFSRKPVLSRMFARRYPCSAKRKAKGNPAAITLASFFKMKSQAESISVDTLSSKNTDIQASASYPSPQDEEPETRDRSRATATCLILFEEVDVIFDEDVGFLSAIKTFISTTKRPVILTTNDPSFRAVFKADFEAILFKTPSAVNTCTYLQLVCLAENIQTEPGDVASLLEVTRGDIRRSLLQVQLWGGGRGERNLPKEASEDSEVAATMEPKSTDGRPLCRLAHRELGCTPSMLGLLNAGLSRDLVNFPEAWMEPDVSKLLEVLRESWRRGVPLLYSNLELLAHSPARTQPSSRSIPEEVAQTGPQNRPRPADIHPHITELGRTASSRTSSRLSRKKRTRASDCGSNHSVSPHRTSLSSNAHSRTSSTNDKPTTINQAQRPESRSLGALADFTDLMSHLDSTLPAPDLHAAGPCGPGEFIWTGAQVTDGLLDEMREEDRGSCGRETVLEIQAALEALAFRTCQRVVSGGRAAGGQGQGRVTEEITAPVDPHRRALSFTRTSVLEPGVSQRRYIANMTVISSRAFSTLGNKRAVAVDYLPILRTICQCVRTQDQASSRFQHYFNRIRLGLSKSSIQLLGQDFP